MAYKPLSFLLLCFATAAYAQDSTFSSNGNPVFPGWYADPEGVIFNHRLWVYPTYSDKYEKQVFFDAFSTKNGKQWTKHPHVLDTAAVKWAKKALWAPAIVEKNNNYYFFL